MNSELFKETIQKLDEVLNYDISPRQYQAVKNALYILAIIEDNNGIPRDFFGISKDIAISYAAEHDLKATTDEHIKQVREFIYEKFFERQHTIGHRKS